MSPKHEQMTKTVRIALSGEVSSHAATTLGGWVEHAADGPVLVAPYLDQAQLTGLLLQLADLHLGFHQVVVAPAERPTVRPPHVGDVR